MDSFEAAFRNDSLQDRINRMSAWKEARRKADEEFIRQQKIRMFINDCDDIRPQLRSHLQMDSKACQLEQIEDLRKRLMHSKDLDKAWHEVLYRDYSCKTKCEKHDMAQRNQKEKSVQDYIKTQMYEKMQTDAQRETERINQELEQISIQRKKEEKEDEEKRLRLEQTRKIMKETYTKQMEMNEKKRVEERKRALEIEKILNKKIEDERKHEEKAKEEDRDQFRREVFQYLDYLRKNKHQNVMEESEKEKLIEDIRQKKNEMEWARRCEFRYKRELINKEARAIQIHQIKEQEKMRLREAEKEKEENFKFNERELNDRLKLNEEKYMKKVKAKLYGKELMEQKKLEELRDLAEKQKLDEHLKLAEIEREQKETMGREFIKSYQDMLPIHSNLLIIRGAIKK